MTITNKPYSQRSDTEKLESNWRKTLGLFERDEHSMAIIRAGTCAEIAANIVIRSELVQKRHLESQFVDSLLRWSNGLDGKFSHIILPLFDGTPRHAALKKKPPGTQGTQWFSESDSTRRAFCFQEARRDTYPHHLFSLH
jgi:hypothetical protein